MSDDLFRLTQFFANDDFEIVGEDMTAEEAVLGAKQLTESLGGRFGTTRRIIITDPEDCIVFEWLFGQGVVFPPRETPP